MKQHPLGLTLIIAFAWAVVAAPLLAARAADIQTTAETLYITDYNTGAVLMDKNGEGKIEPASLTKMMTAYLLFEALKSGKLKLTDSFPVSERAWRMQGSKMYVELGNNIKVEDLLRGIVAKGEGVLFVCTKKQLKAIVQSEAATAGAFYVTERWLGGMLTNFQTVKKQIKRLRDLEQGATEGDFSNYTKKERLMFEREREKLSRNLEGVKMMTRLPGALFVVDAKKEKIAVAEANKLGIPVVAIVDTNADPDVITVPVPGNDDAIRSVSLITAALSDVIKEARQQMPMREVSEDLEAETYSTDTGSEGDAEDRKRRRPRRKRRPKPEAIAARLKTDADGAEAATTGAASEGA